MTMSRSALLAAILTVAACTQDTGTDLDFRVTPPENTLFVGEFVQLTAVGAPGAVTWSSSNSSIASVVPETGFVNALSRGEATISAVAGSDVASAMVRVEAQPEIGVSVPQVDFQITDGDPDPNATTVNVTNLGDGTLNQLAVAGIQYDAGQQTQWLEATLSGNSAPATLTLRARRMGLPVGVYSASVQLTATNAVNAPQSLLVTFRIVTPPSIVLSRTEVPLAGIPGSVVNGTVQITNGGTLPLTGLSFEVQHAGGVTNWLSAQLSSTSAPATLTLTAATGFLPQGQYSALVIVRSSLPNVQPRNIQVFLTVTPGPAIGLSRTIVPFSAFTGGANPAPETVMISNAGGGNLTGLAVSAPQYITGTPGWLTAQLSGTTAPATLTLTANATPLGNGNYTASVQISSPVSSNGPLTINVTLTKGPAPLMVVNPGSLTFATFSGGTAPPAQNVAITNAGGGTIAGLSTNITYTGAGGWLTATFVAGSTTAPATLQLRPNSTLPAGTYTANVEVLTTTQGVQSRTINVTYTNYSFAAVIVPMFQTARGLPSTPCTNCHSGAQPPNLSGSAANVWNQLQSRVFPPNDNTGVLLCKIQHSGACVTGTNMSLPGADVSFIKLWIRSGAPQ